MMSFSMISLLLFVFSIHNAMTSQVCNSQFDSPRTCNGFVFDFTRTSSDYRTGPCISLFFADSNSLIGYCCRYHEEDDHYHACCYYTSVWALWYFWFGIVIFVLLLLICIGAYKKLKKPSRSTTRQTSTQAFPNTELGIVNTEANVDFQDSFKTKFDSAPPSYDQIEAQGISPQFAEYSSYGNRSNTHPNSTEEQQGQPTTSTNETLSPSSS